MAPFSGSSPLAGPLGPAGSSASAVGAVANGRADVAVLLREAGRGRREAFGPLYDLLAPRVFAIGRSVAGEGAAEATLAAFLELWRRAPQWPGGDAAAAAGWALRVAVEALGATQQRGGKAPGVS
ncbi:hypothetical protein QDR37_09945 [Amnibacterium sp. CER49]|uniref:hypothetical protein n=1 Tax=Amnibacterium sp. CER49 TaxID=3039161 RepID=UPI0024499240|nr:hypothetical protein [Amnibacterium sp. CER49]MDH2444265.1 hypothetical protein [Amnibacterium sp. CER49]